jgi:phage terminase large subunit-like protein
MNADEVKAMAADAKRMPSRQPEYENLILNRRVAVNAPFISRAIWNDCSAEVADDLEGYDVFAGLDLSETSDLTAFVRVARIEGAWQREERD